jgi:hypothetical protein
MMRILKFNTSRNSSCNRHAWPTSLLIGESDAVQLTLILIVSTYVDTQEGICSFV